MARTSALQSDGVLSEAGEGIRYHSFSAINTYASICSLQYRYRYVDRMGEEHRGSSGYLEPEEAAEWKAGDVGVVRFDPRRPSRSIWIGRPEEL